MAYFRTGGGGKIETTLLGTLETLTTSNKTMTLDDSIENYQYLIISMSLIGSNEEYQSNLLRPILLFAPVSYFKTQVTFNETFGGGSSGSISYYTCTITYLTDTTIRFKLSSSANARNAYVYGLK